MFSYQIANVQVGITHFGLDLSYSHSPSHDTHIFQYPELNIIPHLCMSYDNIVDSLPLFQSSPRLSSSRPSGS